ncbi:MAG TPA: N-6 DNA methylase, partial [Vicinamibacterales bacterium]|nr:N-6 DNA methylase [Vicinamibacterales bacterium]
MAVPIMTALGFEPPSHVETVGPTAVASLRVPMLEARPVAHAVDASRHGEIRSDFVPRAVALLVSSWGDRLDALWRPAVTAALKRQARWCLVCNGVRLRVVDGERLYARRYVEFDIDLAVADERCFSALWTVMSSSALTGSSAGTPIIPLSGLVASSDAHASAVCASLRNGVLEASRELLTALVANQPLFQMRLDDSFEQALTIIYRILFLLFAEARGLVPLWHQTYRESYSIEALRDLAEQSARAPGIWDALRAIARLAHAGCRAGTLRVTPFNGRLFAPTRTPLAERRDLDDEPARRALMALSTRQAQDRTGRERIAYRDLGVEQLGAVYETLLDYVPRAKPPVRTRSERIGPSPPLSARHPRARATVTLERGSGLRKSTGTFYTPQPIAEYLVRRALAPLTRDKTPEQILKLRVVDPSMGSGAFLVAVCRYLAHEYETALVTSGACHESDLDDTERARARRTIAERCLYGVDLNPMAVQLARLSMWLVTLAADRPLTFLDHRLHVGDSLVGAWLENLRHAPAPGEHRSRGSHRRGTNGTGRELPLFGDDEVAQAIRQTLPVRLSLEATPDDTLAQIRSKERAFASLCR